MKAIGSSVFASDNNGDRSYYAAAIQLRETSYGGSSAYLPPRISFHWGGVVASQISVESDGALQVINNPGTGYERIKASGFVTASSKDLKEDFRPVDKQEVLNKINQLKITNWKYINARNDERHYGPIAEDFNPLFS